MPSTVSSSVFFASFSLKILWSVSFCVRPLSALAFFESDSPIPRRSSSDFSSSPAGFAVGGACGDIACGDIACGGFGAEAFGS